MLKLNHITYNPQLKPVQVLGSYQVRYGRPKHIFLGFDVLFSVESLSYQASNL